MTTASGATVTASAGALHARWGQRVAEVRYSVGKSQTRLAADAGLSRGQVWRIETGRSAPSDSARIRIAAALNTTPADLFTYDEAAA